MFGLVQKMYLISNKGMSGVRLLIKYLFQQLMGRLGKIMY